jgi:hypothetical protein
VAVGGHGNSFNDFGPGTLAERWNGSRWRVQPTPTPLAPDGSCTPSRAPHRRRAPRSAAACH